MFDNGRLLYNIFSSKVDVMVNGFLDEFFIGFSLCLLPCFLDCRRDRFDNRTDISFRLAVSIDGSNDGSASLMAENHDEGRAYVLRRIFYTSQDNGIRHIPCHTDDEDLAECFIKDDLGRYSGVGT